MLEAVSVNLLLLHPDAPALLEYPHHATWLALVSSQIGVQAVVAAVAHREFALDELEAYSSTDQ